MCPSKTKTMNGGPTTTDERPSNTSSPVATSTVEWRHETLTAGSLKHVDLNGSNGWASPPGNLFSLRSEHYLSKKTKSPAPADYLLKPTAVDWLRSNSKLEHILSHPQNRVIHALRTHQSQGKFLKSFIFAVNLQVPGREHHSSVFYFSTDDPIQPGSLLDRFINGDDGFRNNRLKLVNRIVKGPWIVKTAVGNYSACLLGKALTCRYHRGPNYLEIDVDLSSSKIAGALVHLALGCVTSVTIDMGFVVEGLTEEELPEKLIGAVRICQMEVGSAAFVDYDSSSSSSCSMGIGRLGLAKVNHVDGDGEGGKDTTQNHMNDGGTGDGIGTQQR